MDKGANPIAAAEDICSEVTKSMESNRLTLTAPHTLPYSVTR